MEGNERLIIREQAQEKRNYGCLLVAFIISGSIGLAFLMVDRTQTGKIEYTYKCEDGFECLMSNKLACNHNDLIIDCSVNIQHENECCIGLCYQIGYTGRDLIWNIKKVNQSYDKLYANIYYICLCIACIVQYVLTAAIWVLSGTMNAKCCRVKTKHKCLILCFISMIASIICVIFGVISVNKPYNCSNGLYEYIEYKIGYEQWNEYYEWINDAPQMRIGSTLIFMMVNIGITVIFTVRFCHRSLCVQEDNCSTKRYRISIIAEGILQRFSDKSTTKYGSANPAIYTVNTETEGFDMHMID